MNKMEDKLSKAARDFAQLHFHIDERPIAINSFFNGAQWQYEQQRKAIEFCQRIAKMDKGSVPSAGYMQELIEAAKTSLT